MFELLTGKPPFHGDNYAEVLMKQAYEAAPTFAEVAPMLSLPAGVEAIVRKALQKQPDHRFATMGEMAEAIEGLSRGRRIETMDDDAGGRPQIAGPMGYADGRQVTGPVAVVPAGRSWIGPILAGVGLLALAGAVLISWPYWQQVAAERQEQRAQQTAPATTEAVPVAAPSTKEEAGDTSAAAEPASTITLAIRTNVDAEIVDVESGEVLGKTNDTEGVALPRGSDTLSLRLRASGYLDYDFQLVPSSDRKFAHEMEPAPKAPTRSKSTQKKSTGAEESKTAPEEQGDIKNPFVH
ncbi:MAG: hypothetical protein KC431_32010 [Myxococcales bacterium]|nr:hypothetical protein [Myxococcales bacterium]